MRAGTAQILGGAATPALNLPDPASAGTVEDDEAILHILRQIDHCAQQFVIVHAWSIVQAKHLGSDR